MKFVRLLIPILIAAMVTGCGHHDSSEGKKEESVGITFKAGKGLRISDGTKRIIGLEVVEATEQKLAPEFSVQVQVYGHGNSLILAKADGTNAYATGFVSIEQAKELTLGQKVPLGSLEDANLHIQGSLVRLNSFTDSALRQTEVLIEISDAERQFKTGTTFDALFSDEKAENVTAIPRSALLNTASGTFAYVVNGDYFFRTAIKTGAENENFVEVKDGLYPGDQIVKQPVMTLWLAELQAIKGGADND